jgi:RimJ/RimL family protein N-acetyltransferase
VLRPPTLADVDGAAPYLADPEVMRFLGGEVVPRADAEKVVQRWIDAWEANGVGKFIDWGLGYATEAAAAVRDWASRLGPLISLIAPDNVRSARVAERLGATRGETVAGGRLVVWRHPPAR